MSSIWTLKKNIIFAKLFVFVLSTSRKCVVLQLSKLDWIGLPTLLKAYLPEKHECVLIGT